MIEIDPEFIKKAKYMLMLCKEEWQRNLCTPFVYPYCTRCPFCDSITVWFDIHREIFEIKKKFPKCGSCKEFMPNEAYMKLDEIDGSTK